MFVTWLLAGCLLDKQGYLDRRAQLEDLDGDGFVAEDDCDDSSADVHPGAEEQCDARDQDCDGAIDEDPVDAQAWYADVDGDRHGDPDVRQDACETPEGYVLAADDCDDDRSSVHPGAEEVPYDGLDQDCVDGDLVDVDADGWVATAAGGDDCDDANAAANPAAVEVPYDGTDQDCSGGDLDDIDNDGFAWTEAGGEDCDDLEPAVFPGATESWADGFTDNDCDGEVEPATLEYGDDAWLGERAGAEVGRRVSALGDVDGDGLAEYLAAGIYDSGLHTNGGIVYLVAGTEGGTLASSKAVVAGADDWYLGTGLDKGDDIDGDGIPEFAVSATGWDASRGRTWVLSGGAFAGHATLEPELDAIGSVSGDEQGVVSGLSIAYLGDLAGDGSNWLGIGEPYIAVGSMPEAGRFAAFSSVDVDYLLADGDIQVSGYFDSGHLGFGMAPAGDQDGDGLDDYMVAFESGDVAVILPGGLPGPVLPDDAIFRLSRSEAGAYDREDPQMVGDVDGDGRSDLVSVHAAETFAIFTNLSANPLEVVEDATMMISASPGSYAFDATNLGDLDGDGREETLLPVQWDDSLRTSLAVVWPGSELHYGGSASVDSANLQALSLRTLSAFGYRAALSDDVDGDGSEDIILGGYQDDAAETDAGAVLTIPVPR